MQVGEKYMGKIITEKIIFENKGTFEAYYAAEHWVSEKRYEMGSSSIDGPIGITKGPYNMPYKWRNMTMRQRKSVDGIIVGELREGPVVILMF